MPRSLNKVLIIGNIGQDPEVRYMPNGNAVTTVSVATTESWKDKQSGERQERTEWHRVVFFSRLCEIVGEYLHKGSKIYIEGSLRSRKWQDKNGLDRYTTEIIANEMLMLDTRSSSTDNFKQRVAVAEEGADTTTDDGGDATDTTVGGGASAGATGTFDDDIPF